MHRRRLISLVLGVFGSSLEPTNAEERAETPVRIMCVGDSITEGSRVPSYRFSLYATLSREGFSCEFVGSKTSHEEGADLPHEGYGGKTISFLLDTVPRNFADHTADIVLLHAGHNNFAKDQPIPNIVRDTHALIDALREINPKVTVLLAQVITSGKLPKYSYLPDLNIALAELAAEIRTEESRVVLVDHATGFDFETMATADKVHPNAQGAAHMASQWAQAILSLKNLTSD